MTLSGLEAMEDNAQYVAYIPRGGPEKMQWKERVMREGETARLRTATTAQISASFPKCQHHRPFNQTSSLPDRGNQQTNGPIYGPLASWKRRPVRVSWVVA